MHKLNYFVSKSHKALIIKRLDNFRHSISESLNTSFKYQKCKRNGAKSVNNPKFQFEGWKV